MDIPESIKMLLE